MADQGKKPEKIGFSADLRERVSIWQLDHGHRTFSGAVGALLEQALREDDAGMAEEIGRAGKLLNKLLALAEGPRTPVSRAQAETLAKEFLATLPQLQGER